MSVLSFSSCGCSSPDPFRRWENTLRKRKLQDLNAALDTGEQSVAELQHNSNVSTFKLNGCSLDINLGLSSVQEFSHHGLVAPVTKFSEALKNGNLSGAMDAIEEQLKQASSSNISQDLVLLVQKCIEERNLNVGSRLLRCLSEDSGLVSDPLLRRQLSTMLCLPEGPQKAVENSNESRTDTNLGWDAFMHASLNLGQHEKVLELYQAIQKVSLEPNLSIFAAALEACTVLEAHAVGASVHMHAIQLGYDMGDLITRLIIDMYCRFGSVSDARRTFCRLSGRSTSSWSSLIEGYCRNGDWLEALVLLREMQREGLSPSSNAFVELLRFCCKPTDLELGKHLHAIIIEVGVERDLMVSNGLITMYSECENLDDACIVLDRIQIHSIVTWNALLNGYAQHGCFEKALGIFDAMQWDECWPDEVTYMSLLKACCSVEHLEKGKQLHTNALIFGLDINSSVGNSLLNMHVKCGSCEDAHAVFSALPEKNVVSWNVMIRGYLEHDYSEEALSAQIEMQEAGTCPDCVTCLHLLKVCSNSLALEEGQRIHSLIIQIGNETENFLNNALIDMYGKCGRLEDAFLIFDKMPKKCIVSWNALMTGYALHNQAQETLQLYLLLEQQKGIVPNKVTYLSAIKACVALSALGWGKRIHDAIKRSDLLSELSITNALVDMYAKCGSLKDARKVFDKSLKRNVITWSALMTGYAEQSDYDSTVHLFNEMQQEGIDPDGRAFLILLSACSHKGLVENALFHLREMRERHGIPEMLEHIDCIVDLVGSRGLFDVAEDLLETTCFKSNTVGWLSLLGSCRIHANVEMARRCFHHINAVARDHAAAYVMLSSVYARAGMHKEAEELEIARVRKDSWKKTGQSFIEVDNLVHCFMADDKTHPQTLGIHSKLESLSWQVKGQGLLSSSPSFIAQKQDLFCRHSEQLAISFGLLNTPPKSPIRISKNIRVCPNCHEAIKLISKVEQREIIVKDVDCIHNFTGGTCSCEDRDYVNGR